MTEQCCLSQYYKSNNMKRILLKTYMNIYYKEKHPWINLSLKWLNSAVCLSTPNQITSTMHLLKVLPILTYAFITTVTELESAIMIGESPLRNINVRSIKRYG